MEEELEFARKFARKYQISGDFYGVPFIEIPGHIIGEIRRLKTLLEDSGYPPTEENLFVLMKMNKLLYQKALSTPEPETIQSLQRTVSELKPVAGLDLLLEFILVTKFLGIILYVLKKMGLFSYVRELLAQDIQARGPREPEILEISEEIDGEPLRKITLTYWRDRFKDKTFAASIDKLVAELKKKKK